jgi:NAD(P)-dependent dehydrogenase (short-subunit alcohol dehydrogenase family)
VKLYPDKVVITAGASGIGLAIARAFIAAGADVYICDVDRDAISALEISDPAILAHHCDVADPDQVDQFFDIVTQRFGGLDVLINNAGIRGPTGDPETITAADWRQTIDVNVNGTFYCVRRAVAPLKKHGGVIINIASAAIARGGFPQRLPYATSKMAMIGLTDTLAMDLGRFGIRVNAVLPGTVIGQRMQAIIEDRGHITGKTPDVLMAEAVRSNSMRTGIGESEVAEAVLFLCSENARHISGQALSVCGNFEGHQSWSEAELGADGEGR